MKQLNKYFYICNNILDITFLPSSPELLPHFSSLDGGTALRANFFFDGNMPCDSNFRLDTVLGVENSSVDPTDSGCFILLKSDVTLGFINGVEGLFS